MYGCHARQARSDKESQGVAKETRGCSTKSRESEGVKLGKKRQLVVSSMSKW